MELLGVFGKVLHDPLFVGLLVIMLAFVFFIYLFIRRIMTGFQEGIQKGQR